MKDHYCGALIYTVKSVNLKCAFTAGAPGGLGIRACPRGPRPPPSGTSRVRLLKLLYLKSDTVLMKTP